MKKIIVLVVLAVLVVGGFTLYRANPGVLGTGGGLVLYGNVDIRDVPLGFRVSGRISEMRHEEGDAVKKGDVIAVLDKVPYEEALALYTAQYKEAEANLINAQKIYDRQSGLVKSGAVSTGQYDDAIAGRDAALAQLETARAAVAQATTQLQDTELAAPDDGIILTRVGEVGAVVAQGATVYSLALNSPVWIRAYIDEPDLGRIATGEKVTVHTDGGNAYTGQIGYISPQAEFTPKSVETTELRTDLVYRLRIIVSNPDDHLRQGMPVTVTMEQNGGDAAGKK